MPSRSVEVVWFWPYSVAPFKAVYGRLGKGGYTKDYLQTSNLCSEVFDRIYGRTGQQRYPITYRWPGGSRTDVVKPGGGYRPPDDRRLNFRWPYDDSPEPWRLSLLPGPIAAFPGDPSRKTAIEADAELEKLSASDYEPWILAVKLHGEDGTLHVRAYMGNPPADRGYASTSNLPLSVRSALDDLPAGRGCGTYEPSPGEVVWFDPERVFDAWLEGAASPAPEFGLVLVLGSQAAFDSTGGYFSFQGQDASLAAPGTPIVYFVRDGASGRYVGAGVLGAGISGGNGETEAEIVSYRSFAASVDLISPSGAPFESQAALEDPGSVRIIPIAVLEQIIGQAALADDEQSVIADAAAAGGAGYASSELARLVDAYAMEVAMGAAVARYPAAQIRRMPQNNPGYDIRVAQGGTTVRYIEVKGTRGERGFFFISEGEREFSEAKAGQFSLLVVRSIDLDARTHQVVWYDEPVDRIRFDLRVRQWQGEIPD